MKRIPIRAALCVLLCVFAEIRAETIGYLAPRKSAQISASPWGVQSGDYDLSPVGLFGPAGEIGVKWTRTLAVWPSIEKEKGRYDFAPLDRRIDAARANGITPFICITDGNRLYSRAIPNPDPNWRLIYGVKPAPPILDDAATEAWLRYVEAAVRHEGDRVDHWEIWNEPNHYGYWGAPPNAAAYGKLVRLTAARIKVVQPRSVIIAGAVAGLDPKYIAGFLAEDTAHAVEIVSFHNYASLPEARMYLADNTWQVLRARDPKLQLWQGECGYPSASSTGGFRGLSPWGPMVQAKWLLRQSFVDTFFMRATLSSYFTLFSSGNRAEKQERPQLRPVDAILGYPANPDGRRVRGNGVNEKCLLGNPDLTPKPAYYAYRNLAALMDSRYAPADFATKPIVIVRDSGQFSGVGDADDAYPSVPLVAGYRAGSSWLVAYWLPWQPQEYTPKPARITLKVPGAKFNSPELVNLLDGSVHPIPAPHQENGAAVFDDLPLLDFPLVVVERAEVSVLPQRSTPAFDAIPVL